MGKMGGGGSSTGDGGGLFGGGGIFGGGGQQGYGANGQVETTWNPSTGGPVGGPFGGYMGDGNSIGGEGAAGTPGYIPPQQAVAMMAQAMAPQPVARVWNDAPQSRGNPIEQLLAALRPYSGAVGPEGMRNIRQMRR